MKKNIILFSLLLISIFSFGQTTSVLIPGTKYSMIPPEGFILSPNFSGFQNIETGASIMIMDIPTSYSSLVQGFTKDALKTKGMDLLSKENVRYKNSDAMLYKVSQKANGINYLKQILLFGDKNITVMVNGIYPEQSNDSENELKKSLFTIERNEKLAEKPLQSVNFSINVEGTDYKLVKSLAGSLLYSEDDKIPSDKGLLIVSNSLGNKVNTDYRQFSIDRLKKLPDASNSIIKTIDKVTISDMEGYEIVAEDNSKQLIYQVTLFSSTREYYIIVGQSKGEKEKNLEVYKKVAKTFKLN